MKCRFCGKEIKGRNQAFCNVLCESNYLQNYKSCIVCGKSFPCAPSSPVLCCSSACSRKHREKLHASGVYSSAVDKMLSGKKAFFVEHSGEKHINAKFWRLKSPDGRTYECRNLMHFIKSNSSLFDGTPDQAFDGISKIKASYQGKRKRPCYTWKGWQLLSWSD